MTEGQVHFSRDGAVAILEIDHPPTNTLGRAMRTAFLARMAEIEADSSLRAVIVTGRGRAFCSGDDLKEQELAQAGTSSAERTAHFGSFGEVFERLEAGRLPVIAAVNGWCVGGGLELALCCDIRIASSEVRFVCAAVNVGLMASAWRLPRLIGTGPAKHMLLTGSPFGAEEALRFRLVTAVHAPDRLIEEAKALAARIASRAPLSVEATKRMASMALDLKPEEFARVNANELRRLGASADHRAALAAFREKREPIFTRQ